MRENRTYGLMREGWREPVLYSTLDDAVTLCVGPLCSTSLKYEARRCEKEQGCGGNGDSNQQQNNHSFFVHHFARGSAIRREGDP